MQWKFGENSYAIIVGSLVFAACNVQAADCRICRKATPLGSDVCSRCETSENNKFAMVSKALTQKYKGMQIVMPKQPNRVESFCGYRFGAFLSARSKGTIDGLNHRLCVEERLKKPFRLCTRATVRYTETTGVLCGVTIRSQPQRMSEEQAKQELDGIIAALKEKYGDKLRLAPSGSRSFNGNLGAIQNGQHVSVNMSTCEVAPKHGLKGPNVKPETAYIFSVTMNDAAVARAEYPPADKPLGISGAEAL